MAKGWPKNRWIWMSKLYFRSDFDKVSLLNTFHHRGWEDDPDDWNVYWANKESIKHIFSHDNAYRLRDDQILNHFPNYYQLTRKDLMVRNIKRYARDCQKYYDKSKIKILNYIPTTYVLPGDYTIFKEDFRRSSMKWIVKPIAKSRGIGVFIVTKLSQVKKWSRENRPYISNRDQQVISKYIDRPLLVGGKKFDLRLYVLVTSYRPLKVYMHRQGFCRFCVYNYSNDSGSLENMFIHLTNVAIQKHGRKYNDKHGGKWSFQNLLFYIECQRGKKAADRCLKEIQYIVIHSLKACQNVMINDKHCFEMYGYDILLDEDLRPWLLEINASPSLTSTTQADRILKTKLIHDVFQIVVRKDFPHILYKDYRYDDDRTWNLGDFYVLFDEYNGYYGDMPSDLRVNHSKGTGPGGSRGFTSDVTKRRRAFK